MMLNLSSQTKTLTINKMHVFCFFFTFSIWSSYIISRENVQPPTHFRNHRCYKLHFLLKVTTNQKKWQAADKSGRSNTETPAYWAGLKILIISSELTRDVSSYSSPFFRSPILQGHGLNQLSGHAVEAQFWFTVSPTELNRSAMVTSLLTLSSSLMWAHEGLLHMGCGAYPESGEA